MAETQAAKKATAPRSAPTDPGSDEARQAALEQHAEQVRNYTTAQTKPVPPAASDGVTFHTGVGPDAKEVDLSKVATSSEATVVTLDHDVYETFPAPGAPNRKITRLLYAKGRAVPKAALAAHADRQRTAQAAAGSKSAPADDED